MNGVFKTSPEDFEVEEIPAYAPSGEGEHLFLWVEKRGVSTPDAAKRLCRGLGLTDRDISWAGLKDKQAVTRQFFSVPAARVADVAMFADPEVRVLSATRHRNKLKNGHLRGNRFTLVVRSVSDASAFQRAFDGLVARGVPNFFGEQRFGSRNAEVGKKLLLEGGRMPKFERKLMLSAYQSLLFNRALERRLAGAGMGVALLGDVLKKQETGGEFVCADPLVDGPRVAAFEVSPTGPMFGPEMRRAEGDVGAAEQALLDEEGITPETFEAGGDETRGTRRLFRVLLGEPALSFEGDVARVVFTLPSGSYATVVLGLLTTPPQSS